MTDAGAPIGATELLVGVPFPVAALEILRSACGDRAEEAVLTARLWKGADAVDAGLVHEYVDADGLLERAIAVADELGAIAPDSYRMAKEQLRRPAIERIAAGAANDLEVRRIWSSPATATAIQAQLDRVAGRARAKRSRRRRPRHRVGSGRTAQPTPTRKPPTHHPPGAPRQPRWLRSHSATHANSESRPAGPPLSQAFEKSSHVIRL